eukprot:symbB.v1.2.018880.t1/scaffold1500.1/size115144/4
MMQTRLNLRKTWRFDPKDSFRLVVATKQEEPPAKLAEQMVILKAYPAEPSEDLEVPGIGAINAFLRSLAGVTKANQEVLQLANVFHKPFFPQTHSYFMTLLLLLELLCAAYSLEVFPHCRRVARHFDLRSCNGGFKAKTVHS